MPWGSRESIDLGSIVKEKTRDRFYCAASFSFGHTSERIRIERVSRLDRRPGWKLYQFPSFDETKSSRESTIDCATVKTRFRVFLCRWKLHHVRKRKANPKDAPVRRAASRRPFITVRRSCLIAGFISEMHLALISRVTGN